MYGPSYFVTALSAHLKTIDCNFGNQIYFTVTDVKVKVVEYLVKCEKYSIGSQKGVVYGLK